MRDERALVLGGGGLTGVGWLAGVLAGLAEKGVDLRGNDLTIGTSCGAVVGAQLASGATPGEMFAKTTANATPGPARLLTAQAMAELGALIGSGRNPELARARLGRVALETPPLATEEELRAGVHAMCPFPAWPSQRLLLTSVDAETGMFTAFSADSGVSLTDAVTASCALPFVYPPAHVAGRRWVDGFIRSPANADLAAGYARVVVLAPMAEGFSPIGNVPSQVAELTGNVYALYADESVEAVNPNPMDPSHLPAVARAGYAQALTVADEVADVWFG
jgi:NTE family protein